MADDLDDGEFWLPSQFLTDTDDADFDSSTPSSVTETESDEDEFLAELTRQISRHSLRKDSMVSLSPQSTLCPGGVTPTGRVSPPPALARADHLPGGDAVSFNLLNAAAGEIAKMRLQSEQPKKGTGYFDSNNWLLRAPPKHDGFFYRQSEPSQQQLQASQFQQLWSQEMVVKQLNKAPPPQVISRSNNFHTSNNNNNNNNRPLGLSPAAWPPLQHPSTRPPPPSPVGPGMRPLFLGAPGPKRESAGTGVFLPRRVTPTEPPPRKSSSKPGGSAVLVPEKVVQALNNINGQTRCSNGRFRGQNNGVHGPRRNSEPARPHHAEIHLPSEWTY